MVLPQLPAGWHSLSCVCWSAGGATPSVTFGDSSLGEGAFWGGASGAAGDLPGYGGRCGDELLERG